MPPPLYVLKSVVWYSDVASQKTFCILPAIRVGTMVQIPCYTFCHLVLKITRKRELSFPLYKLTKPVLTNFFKMTY
jgi:hypothetical protein